MSYRHDIFISYRRNPETLEWIKIHFLPLLSLRVELELSRRPRIFLDEQLSCGTSWPLQLGTELGCSRIMIALWTGNYLHSNWCSLELSHIVARERETGRRTFDNPRGLLIPAMIHDGDRFPAELADVQYFEIQRCFNVRMARDSPRAEELDSILAKEAPAIAKAIAHAPPWRANWPAEAAQDLHRILFRAEELQQRRLPKFSDR